MALRRSLSSGSLGAFAWLTILIIVYGSLIPFEYRSATFDQAVARILSLRAGGNAVVNRADLVANLLIYIPLGFFACGALSRRTLAGGIVGTILLGAILAVGVEFAQIWVSPRTISLNDILAEVAGLGIGLLLWVATGPRIVGLAHVALHGSYTALRAGLLLYLAAYLFLELSPFDFFVSISELNARLRSDSIVLVSGHYGVGLRAAAAMLSKVVSAAPIGALVYLQTRNWTTVGWVGLALGFGIELVQFFEYSGEADVISVLLRALGCAVGFATVSKLITIKKRPVLFTALAWIAIPIYVLFLNSLLHQAVVSSTADHGTILRQVNWLPFYYFYFSSDQNALSSFANYLKIYTPLGALLWLILDGRRENTAWGAAMVTALIQAGLEAVGFWFYFQRPDITNVLIAALGGGVGSAICMWLKRSLADRPTSSSEPQPPSRPHSPGRLIQHAREETSAASMLSAVVAVFIAYCSLYPFNFALSALTAERVQRLVDLSDGQFSRGDVLGNVLLFVPFGFVAITALRKSTKSPPNRFLTMLGASLALAIATQVPQLFLPRRDAFSWDIIFNVVGAAIGGGLGVRLGHFVTRLKVGPLMSPGLVFSLLWTGALLAPLMPSVDLSRFKASVFELFFPEMFSPSQALVLVAGWLVLAELWRGQVHRYAGVAGLALALSPVFGVRLSWTFVLAPIAALAIAGAGAVMPRTARTVGLMVLMAIGIIIDHIDPSYYGQVSRLPWLNDLLRAVFFIAALIYFTTRISLTLHVGTGLAFGLIFLLSAVAVSFNNDVWIGFDLFVLVLGLLTAAVAKRYRGEETGALS